MTLHTSSSTRQLYELWFIFNLKLLSKNPVDMLVLPLITAWHSTGNKPLPCYAVVLHFPESISFWKESVPHSFFSLCYLLEQVVHSSFMPSVNFLTICGSGSSHYSIPCSALPVPVAHSSSHYSILCPALPVALIVLISDGWSMRSLTSKYTLHPTTDL